LESPAIRDLYNDLTPVIPGLRFGGIYAIKPGYHNKRSANPSANYSVLLAVDRIGPDMASALDLTLNEAEMRRCTKRLRDAALDPHDDRTRYIREFIGTTDGVNVYCLIASGPNTAFVFDSGRDDSHLWHIHLSFYRQYCNDPQAMAAIYSVLVGQSYEEWKGNDMEFDVDDVYKLLHDGLRAGPSQTQGGGIPIAWIVREIGEIQKALDMIKATTSTIPALDYDELAKALLRNMN
jgi:hypothetical protein